MRLVTFEAKKGEAKKGEAKDGHLRAGALVENDTRIVDLQGAHRERSGAPSPMLSSVLAMAEAGEAALEIATEAIATALKSRDHLIDRGGTRLLAPIPRPPQMRDFLCFEKHLVQAFRQARVVRSREFPDPQAALDEMERQGILAVPQTWYERPIFYHPNRLSVIGTDEDVVWPDYSATMDFELEFGAYIGKPGHDIAREDAHRHIFGYTIFNDFSARDEQTREMPGQLGPGKGKDFDGANVMGPCLVTSDELTDPYDLSMAVRVNGEEWGRGSSAEMHWRFDDCIAHVSRSETLHAGEFLGSGTVGNGCGLEQMRFLSSGDVVELEVERIGILRSRVLRRG